MKTAVQELIECIRFTDKECYATMFNEGMFDKALQMEREQMIDFHVEVMKKGLIQEGGKKWDDDYLPKIKEVAEETYTQTFKS